MEEGTEEGGGYPYGNQPAPPEVGDLPGMFGPDNFVSDQAVRAAVSLGVATELRRWEKVALKEVAAGRDPSARVFTSPVLSDDMITSIQTRIAGKPAEQVKGVFAHELSRIESRPADATLE